MWSIYSMCLIADAEAEEKSVSIVLYDLIYQVNITLVLL